MAAHSAMMLYSGEHRNGNLVLDAITGVLVAAG